MLTALFGVLEHGFKLWNTKEGNKYLDRLLKLKKEFYEELARPDASQLTMDRIMLELEGLCEAFTRVPLPKPSAD